MVEGDTWLEVIVHGFGTDRAERRRVWLSGHVAGEGLSDRQHDERDDRLPFERGSGNRRDMYINGVVPSGEIGRKSKVAEACCVVAVAGRDRAPQRVSVVLHERVGSYGHDFVSRILNSPLMSVEKN